MIFFILILPFLIVIRTMRIARNPPNQLLLILPNGDNEVIAVTDFSVDATSSNNLLAYRPRFEQVGSTNLAGLFLNMLGIFPCLESVRPFGPDCGILTDEEDGFRPGRRYIQAGDVGNTLRIFSSSEDIPTYGLAIEGCEELDTDCIPNNYAFTVFCLLPRPQCA